MTIDLGYAHLDHPDGYRLGIVDVPGHEKLVRNMVAGATGFELALWVVDAREGVMPQSLEHLQILDLLGVRALVPVLTKSELATADQIAAAARGVQALLSACSASVRPLHVVDSLSGRGVQELTATILDACRDPEPAGDPALPYLPVDRVFSVRGAGTVVTGTLVHGRLAEGDQVAVTSLPGSWRVRSLNNHHARVAAIGAGHRVGVNLAGVEPDAVRRGDVLVAPGHPHAGRFVNVRLRWVEGAPAEWRHGARLLFYAGCSEAECRLWGLVRDEDAGAGAADDATWAQIELPRPAPFFPGQRFILRSTSPLATVGGGEVLDVAPDRPRRVTASERAAYALRARGEPALAAYLAGGGAPVLDLGAVAARWMVPVPELRHEAERSAALRTGAAGRAGSEAAAAPLLVWHATSKRPSWSACAPSPARSRGASRPCRTTGWRAR
jgi:selenocysteine-specific elongation factor